MAGIREKIEAVFGVSGADKFKREFEQADKTVAKTSKGMTGAMKAVGAAAVAYLSVQLVKSITESVFSLTKLSDSMRVVQTSNERLAKSIGQNSKEILQSVRAGVGGAVDDFTILKQVNQAILLGIPVSAREMGNMAQVATRLGRAVGRDAASALGDLVTGIGRMSPLILDNLGITIKAEDAFRGLGEGATDAEKRLAFFNAVMGKANDLSKTLGEQLPPLGERLAAVGAKLSNLGTRIGDSLSVPIGNLIDRVDALLVRMGTAETKAAAIAKGGSANPNPFEGLPGLELLFPGFDALVNAPSNINRLLMPGQIRRTTAAFEREGAFGQDPKARFNNQFGKINPAMSAASTDPIGGLTPAELLHMWETLRDADFTIEPKIRTEPLIKGFKSVAAHGRKELDKIPESLEAGMSRSFANMSVQLSALGLQGVGGAVGGVGQLLGGVSGLLNTRANKDLTGSQSALGQLTFGLQSFVGAVQIFSAGVGLFKGVSTWLKGENTLTQNSERDGTLQIWRGGAGRQQFVTLINDAENIIAKANADFNAGDIDEDERNERVQEGEQLRQLNTRELDLFDNPTSSAGTSRQTGSNAFSVATSISESQANSILAVLETQRAQDAERNSILGASLAVQNDMKFLMSINSGNLMTFAG